MRFSAEFLEKSRRPVSLLFAEVDVVAVGFEESVSYHFGNHCIEGYFRDPTQVGFGFRGITRQGLYFCGTEVPRIK